MALIMGFAWFARRRICPGCSEWGRLGSVLICVFIYVFYLHFQSVALSPVNEKNPDSHLQTFYKLLWLFSQEVIPWSL